MASGKSSRVFFAALTDGDLRALYAWLRTVPAIKNQAPDAILAPLPAAH